MKPQKITIVYDGECIFCNHYCKLVCIRKSVGELVLIDARQSSDIMDEITQRGLNIDQGMVVKFHGKLYFGAEAIHILSLLSTHSDLFNTMNAFLFRSKTVSFLLYPILRDVRNFFLWVLNVKKINNLEKSS